MKKRIFNRLLIHVTPWMLIGSALIMVPIIAFWMAQNIQQQKEHMLLLLREKGAALIRSFEAGTRTGMMGMMGMPGPGFQLQRLLMETARQPDIVHLIVVDEQGTILAHNDPSEIGGFYGRDLDLHRIVSSDQLVWRAVQSVSGPPIFEVYRRFNPVQAAGRRNRPWMMRPYGRMMLPADPEQNRIIFVGLDMEPVEAARKQEMRHAGIMALILLLIGGTGFFSLFLVQAYQSTRRSLQQVRAYSDETSRRLAALGRLAAGVAHEIRNPLSSIKGFATFFKERFRENPEERNAAEIMIQEVDRLNRVITQLLDFARPAKMDKKLTDLDLLVRQSLQLIAQEARERGIFIVTDFARQPRPVMLDPDAISQVLLNLFLNALAAMQKGGTLSIRLADEPHTQRVMVRIGDTGHGIKKEDLEHIFDPYFTTKPGGTGLGLAIVHRIIEAHEGEIRVESEPGQGAVFTFFLP